MPPLFNDSNLIIENLKRIRNTDFHYFENVVLGLGDFLKLMTRYTEISSAMFSTIAPFLETRYNLIILL